MKKFYTEEFKKMTVELSYTSDKPVVAEVCKDLGISNSILYRWRKDMIVDAKSPDSQEVKELKKKLS
ncbi:MAG: transposase, partial [Candidatus Sericytochromatia bacterium]|nr:transposase [Candidatus Sericytochromatia bacterium]